MAISYLPCGLPLFPSRFLPFRFLPPGWAIGHVRHHWRLCGLRLLRTALRRQKLPHGLLQFFPQVRRIAVSDLAHDSRWIDQDERREPPASLQRSDDAARWNSFVRKTERMTEAFTMEPVSQRPPRDHRFQPPGRPRLRPPHGNGRHPVRKRRSVSCGENRPAPAVGSGGPGRIAARAFGIGVSAQSVQEPSPAPTGDR